MTHAESTGARQPLTPSLSVAPGSPRRHENLTVFPLTSGPQPDLPRAPFLYIRPRRLRKIARLDGNEARPTRIRSSLI